MIRFDERVLNGMSVFAAIVAAGSFAAAGELLDMSQPGVSRAVSRLEARLGIRLFDRTTRAVSLTEEGRRFHTQVLPLLAGIEEAASTAADGATAVRGRLRVNADPYFSRLILGPRLGTFLESHPELQFELVTQDRLGDLVSGGFDLAVRFGEPGASSLVARKLLDTRIVTVAAPSYLKRRGRPLDPTDLGDAGARVYSLHGSQHGPSLGVGVSPQTPQARGARSRPADSQRCRDSAQRLPGGPGHSADQGVGCRVDVGRWEARRPVSRLAGRAVLVICVTSVPTSSAGQNPRLPRFRRLDHRGTHHA